MCWIVFGGRFQNWLRDTLFWMRLFAVLTCRHFHQREKSNRLLIVSIRECSNIGVQLPHVGQIQSNWTHCTLSSCTSTKMLFWNRAHVNAQWHTIWITVWISWTFDDGKDADDKYANNTNTHTYAHTKWSCATSKHGHYVDSNIVNYCVFDWVELNWNTYKLEHIISVKLLI